MAFHKFITVGCSVYESNMIWVHTDCVVINVKDSLKNLSDMSKYEIEHELKSILDDLVMVNKRIQVLQDELNHRTANMDWM